MGFFKKLFGSKENDEPKKEQQKETNQEPKNESPMEAYDKIPWMTDLRRENLKTCLAAGFKPASSLPTEFERQLRPPIEIAKRLHAIKAIVLWLMVPEANLPSEKILEFVDKNGLKEFLIEKEKEVLTIARDDVQARNAIGWKFENAWPLAWYFGYQEPDMMGQMMTGEQMQEILGKHSCRLEENMEEWVASKRTVTEEDLKQKEDLFYCLHNAVRSAQLGSDTVPNGFHPVGNGGVIHERRHSLTWMLSKGTSWEDTDLST